jgi:hypothetical protein
MYKNRALDATAELLAKKGTDPVDTETNAPVWELILTVSEMLRREVANAYNIS